MQYILLPTFTFFPSRLIFIFKVKDSGDNEAEGLVEESFAELNQDNFFKLLS